MLTFFRLLPTVPAWTIKEYFTHWSMLGWCSLVFRGVFNYRVMRTASISNTVRDNSCCRQVAWIVIWIVAGVCVCACVCMCMCVCAHVCACVHACAYIPFRVWKNNKLNFDEFFVLILHRVSSVPQVVLNWSRAFQNCVSI